jgi:MFS family permease
MAVTVDRAAPQAVAPKMSVFTLVWLGQVVSLMGTGLTGFGLGIWVYQLTGSITQLALITVCSRLPGIATVPIAGALIDRWDRRRAMIYGDLGGGLTVLILALLYFAGHIAVWHICVAMAINSALSASQWTAYSAATTMLVPKRQLGRAAGMVQTGEAIALIVSPALGGVLLVSMGVYGIFLLDFAMKLFATVTLFLVRIPTPPKTIEDIKPSLLSEIGYGWRYITSRPGLLALLVFFAVTNFLSGFIFVLTTPLVLSFSTPSVLGTVVSIGGIGMLIGGLGMAAWGAPSRRINGVLGFSVLSGLSFILAGAQPSAVLIALAAFLFYFTLPFVGGSSQAIWQSKVSPEVQGRVFAVRRMIAWSAIPLSYMVAGPLAEYVFEPLLSHGGLLAGSVGRFTGTGPGRGIGFLFVVMGALTLLIVACGYFYPRLRHLEDEIADAIPDPMPNDC